LLTILVGANNACHNCDYFGETPVEKVLQGFETDFRSGNGFLPFFAFVMLVLAINNSYPVNL
jgi:hypothetical protein